MCTLTYEGNFSHGARESRFWVYTKSRGVYVKSRSRGQSEVMGSNFVKYPKLTIRGQRSLEVMGSCQVKGHIEVSRSNGIVYGKMTTAGCK